MTRDRDYNALIRQGYTPEEIDEMDEKEDDERPRRTKEPRVDRDRKKFNPRRPSGRRPSDE